jgi:hypothetical protein
MTFDYDSSEIRPVVEKCIGVGIEGTGSICGRIMRVDGTEIDVLPTEDNLKEFRCQAYLYPDMKWRLGNCPLATHLTAVIEEQKGKRRVGQQKQKKRR